jgi:hypothetical protein
LTSVSPLPFFASPHHAQVHSIGQEPEECDGVSAHLQDPSHPLLPAHDQELPSKEPSHTADILQRPLVPKGTPGPSTAPEVEPSALLLRDPGHGLKQNPIPADPQALRPADPMGGPVQGIPEGLLLQPTSKDPGSVLAQVTPLKGENQQKPDPLDLLAQAPAPEGTKVFSREEDVFIHTRGKVAADGPVPHAPGAQPSADPSQATFGPGKTPPGQFSGGGPTGDQPSGTPADRSMYSLEGPASPTPGVTFSVGQVSSVPNGTVFEHTVPRSSSHSDSSPPSSGLAGAGRTASGGFASAAQTAVNGLIKTYVFGSNEFTDWWWDDGPTLAGGCCPPPPPPPPPPLLAFQVMLACQLRSSRSNSTRIPKASGRK